MGLAFFGLTQNNIAEIRVSLFTQIHEICFWSNGGYDWNTVYGWPIWLRKFTYSLLEKHYKEKNKPAEAQGNKTVIDTEGKIKQPEFLSKVKTKPQESKPITSKNITKYR